MEKTFYPVPEPETEIQRLLGVLGDLRRGGHTAATVDLDALETIVTNSGRIAELEAELKHAQFGLENANAVLVEASKELAAKTEEAAFLKGDYDKVVERANREAELAVRLRTRCEELLEGSSSDIV